MSESVQRPSLMKVIFLNRFYWPETPATGQLLTDLAEGLAALGWEVTVIASSPAGQLSLQETRHGVRVLRAKSKRAGRAGVFGKAVDYATFYASALWRLARMELHHSVVVPMTDPPLLGLGVGLVGCLRGARIVHWIQDIYPEVAVEVLDQRWLQALRPLRNFAWRRSEACTVVGAEMAAALRQARVPEMRIHVLQNWPPVGVSPLARDSCNELRHAWNRTGRFVVAYSGNLGRVHDLEPVLQLADALRNDEQIMFLFIGSGPQQKTLESAASQRGLQNIFFHPPQPRERLTESLSVGDLHLVTLRPGCERYVFPSKLYGIAAAGRPMLFIGPTECDVARTIVDNLLGWAVARDDVAGMVAAVRRCASDPTTCADRAAATLRFAERHSASVAIARWHELLSRVASADPTAR